MINGMIIAIDARMIEMSGIGTYIQHLMGKGIYDYAIGNKNLIKKYDKTVKIIHFEATIYGLKEQLGFPVKAIKAAKIELLHFPHYNVPVLYKGKYIVTVHDLTHIFFPEFLGNKIKYYYAKFLMDNAVKMARHVFTVSENSKKDICSIFKTNKDKISVTYNAVDKNFKVKRKESIEYLYEKFSIPKGKNIILYVGNLKPHKNIGNLLKAFNILDCKKDCILVLVGKAFANYKLKEQEEQLGIKQSVFYTGLVSKEELVDLYNLANIFVFPSLYEGFGIPLLEAMACGTPVVAANNSSIPEVVGNAALLFNAYDINDIAEKIQQLLTDKDEQMKCVERGFERISGFSWDNTVSDVKRIISIM